MEKIKKNYTNFVLTVIAVAMIGILFKGEIVKPVHALGTNQLHLLNPILNSFHQITWNQNEKIIRMLESHIE